MKVGIALGSNLGDRLANLRFGREQILARTDLAEPDWSPVYETSPVDCPPGSGNFLNAVLVGRSELDPEEWLDLLLAIEEDAGRVRRGEVNAPRPLDLDLLFCGGHLRSTPRLLLPHPCLPTRRFVLQPLADIDPGFLVPGLDRTVRTLLEGCVSDEPPLVRVFQDW
jgi:2-amino-4-hydroxy-6-hydroxymethyldihydropteridine diphosphokinase